MTDQHEIITGILKRADFEDIMRLFDGLVHLPPHATKKRAAMHEELRKLLSESEHRAFCRAFRL